MSSILKRKFYLWVFVSTVLLSILGFAGTTVADETVDNSDTASTSSTGSWQVSSGTTPFDPSDPSANSLWARGGDDTFTWSFSPTQTGTYEVWEWHSGWSSRTTAAPHQIRYAGGTANVSVNQRVNAGQWNSLGTYPFAAGTTYTVTVTSVADSSSTCADAVRWTLVGEDNLPPTAVIDSISPNPATDGQTVEFNGGGSSDIDGTIVDYHWSSSIDGDLGDSASFSSSDLSTGSHTIVLEVQDDDGAWSDPVSQTLTITVMSDDTIADNSDTASTSSTGSWQVSGGTTPFDPSDPSANSLWARGGDDTFTWSFSPTQTGTYEVWEWHSGWSSRTTAAPHQIRYAGGTANVSVNQRVNAGQWNSLGTYPFAAGTTYTVTVTSVADSSSTCADAVRWTLVGEDNLPPTAVIDSISPNPATEGQTVEFNGGGSSDIDGTIVDYHWSSSIDGDLGDSASFSSSDLSTGSHTIVLEVQDDDGAWSDPVSRTLTITVMSDDTIADNSDTASTSSTGSWQVSGGTTPFDPSDPSANSLWARGGDDTFTWSFSPTQTGTYEVWEWHSGWSSRTTAAPHQIRYAGGTANVSVNQRVNAGQWNSLGTYPFAAGTTYTVTVTSVADSSSTCADAVRWTLVGEDNLPPTAVIDSISPNPATEGQQVTFTGHGNDVDGEITGYRWSSSIDGVLNHTASFTTTALSSGGHTIFFEVCDNEDEWSAAVTTLLTVNDVTAVEEHIYYCIGYGVIHNPLEEAEDWFDTNGFQKVNGLWQYTNGSGKAFIFHIIQDIEGMRQALMTENAHVIYRGHANYGMGVVFVTESEQASEEVTDIYTIDDPRIFNISSPWFHVSVRGLITNQAYPNWWPIFQDGTSGVMNYDFGETTGTPPYYYDTPAYNYYITYQIPGDPSGTNYLMESVNFGALERFPDSGTPAWYAADGSEPDPDNPDHLQYFITNPEPPDPDDPYPKTHFGRKTILFRKALEIPKDEMKYSRFFYQSCNSGNYYLTTFNHGIVFYTVNNSGSHGFWTYVRNYIDGMSDRVIWQRMQAREAVYDYYNFNKLPSQQ